MGDSAHTTHHTNPGEKSAPPFFSRMRTFFKKSASMVPREIRLDGVPWSPIFEKCSHLREKGVLMLLKITPHLFAKAQYIYE
jgi:hypothetical protein